MSAKEAKPSRIPLADALGRPAREVLEAEPFSRWRATRSIDPEFGDEIRYKLEGHGVELICDASDRIRTVFLRRRDGEALAGLPYSLTRSEVLSRFGTPAKSGSATRIAGLGDIGPWDRFPIPQGALHVQYRLDRDEIEMITLMRADVVP
jgi:hypothetical protein